MTHVRSLPPTLPPWGKSLWQRKLGYYHNVTSLTVLTCLRTPASNPGQQDPVSQVTDLGLSDGSQTRPSGISKPTGLPSRFRSQGREDGVSICVTTEPRACVASEVWRPQGSLRAPALTELTGLRGDREGQGQRG